MVLPDTVAGLRDDPMNIEVRTIGSRAIEGLGSTLTEFGDLGGITWNARTRELVSGHQRVKALRALAQRFGFELKMTESGIYRPAFTDDQGQAWPEEMYPIRVVDWDREKQQAANLVANNTALQGTYTDRVVSWLRQVEARSPKTFDRGQLGAIDLMVQKVLEEPKKTRAAADKTGGTRVKESFQVLITCKDEQEQIALLNRLQKEGVPCRALIS